MKTNAKLITKIKKALKQYEEGGEGIGCCEGDRVVNWEVEFEDLGISLRVEEHYEEDGRGGGGPLETKVFDEDDKEIWNAGRPAARDGFVLANGNVLIAWGDEVRELTRETEIIDFEVVVWRGPPMAIAGHGANLPLVQVVLERPATVLDKHDCVREAIAAVRRCHTKLDELTRIYSKSGLHDAFPPRSFVTTAVHDHPRGNEFTNAAFGRRRAAGGRL